MVWIVLLLLLVVACFAPSWWARRVMKAHSTERPDFPGTGGELARHLVERFQLDGVKVERLERGGDHYDPRAKAIRLTPDKYEGRSVTAVAVAAHEFGHALQDAESYGPLNARTKLIPVATWAERGALLLLGFSPVLLAIAPRLALLQALSAFVVMGGRVVVHAVTLPVENDASFNRALPILAAGEYLGDEDLPAARQVLRAAALTYVAAALASLLNVARWIRAFR